MEVQDIVLRYVEAFEARDAEGCAKCFADRGTYSDPTRPTPIGREEIAEQFDGIFVGFPDAVTERGLDAISADAAVWRCVIRGTHMGPYRGAPPTGRTIEVPGCEFIDVRDGLIQRVLGYYDRLTILIQLGLVPNPAGRSA